MVLACTDRCTGMSGYLSRTSIIKPGSAMMSASGFMVIRGCMSAWKVLSLLLCGRVFTVR